MTTTPGHPDTETFLNAHACDWTYEPALPVETIDHVASVTNQVRFEAIDEPTVERYVAALHAGDRFPPIIARHVDGQVVILSGNHRHRAHLDAERTTINAYLVTCDELTAREIAYGDNARHGLPPTDAERLAHALDLVDRGRTMMDAARIVGINHQRIVKRQHAVTVEARAARLGLAAELTGVQQSVRYRLVALRDDRVFTKVVRAAAANNISSPVLAKMIGDINAQPDVNSAIELLNAFVREHRAGAQVGRKAGHPSGNPYLMLRTALGTVKGLNAADVVDACRTPRDRKDLHELLRAGVRHLMAVDQLLQAGNQTDGRVLEVVR